MFTIIGFCVVVGGAGYATYWFMKIKDEPDTPWFWPVYRGPSKVDDEGEENG